MIPETCVLSNKHKLYVVLHHECTVEPGIDVCGECTYFKQRQEEIKKKYQILMAPRNSGHTHNMDNSLLSQHLFNKTSTSSGRSQTDFFNNIDINNYRIFPSDDSICQSHHVPEKTPLSIDEPDFFEKVRKVINIIFKGGTNNDS